jgi:hypothetical protein
MKNVGLSVTRYRLEKSWQWCSEIFGVFDAKNGNIM